MMNSNPVNVGLSVDSEDLILLNDYIDLLLDPTLPIEQFEANNCIPVLPKKDSSKVWMS